MLTLNVTLTTAGPLTTDEAEAVREDVHKALSHSLYLTMRDVAVHSVELNPDQPIPF